LGEPDHSVPESAAWSVFLDQPVAENHDWVEQVEKASVEKRR